MEEERRTQDLCIVLVKYCLNGPFWRYCSFCSKSYYWMLGGKCILTAPSASHNLISIWNGRIDHFSVVCSVIWPLNGKLEVILFWFRPLCFCCVNQDVLMLARYIYRPGHRADNCKMVYWKWPSNRRKMSIVQFIESVVGNTING